MNFRRQELLGKQGKKNVYSFLTSGGNVVEKISTYQGERKFSHCKDSGILLKVLSYLSVDEGGDEQLHSVTETVLKYILLELEKNFDPSNAHLIGALLPYGKFPAIKDLLFSLLRRVPEETALVYLRSVVTRPDIYSALPLELKRTVWCENVELFRKEFFKRLKKYVPSAAKLHKERIFDDLWALMGGRKELYVKMCFFVRKLYENSKNTRFSSFKIDMFNTRRYPREFKQIDPTYRFYTLVNDVFRRIESNELGLSFGAYGKAFTFLRVFHDKKDVMWDFRMIVRTFLPRILQGASSLLLLSHIPHNSSSSISMSDKNIEARQPGHGHGQKKMALGDILTLSPRDIVPPPTSEQQVRINRSTGGSDDNYVMMHKVCAFMQDMFYFSDNIPKKSTRESIVVFDIFRWILHANVDVKKVEAFALDAQKESYLRAMLRKDEFFRALFMHVLIGILKVRNVVKFRVLHLVVESDMYFSSEFLLTDLVGELAKILEEVHSDYFHTFEKGFIREKIMGSLLERLDDTPKAVHIKFLFWQLISKYLKLALMNEEVAGYVDKVMDTLKTKSMEMYTQVFDEKFKMQHSL